MKPVKAEQLPGSGRRAYEEALKARLRASAPYSGFKVGAVVVDEFGRHHTGCNVESQSYGLTVCAERVAIGNMIDGGGTQVKELYVVLEGGNAEGGSPCGACRQVAWDHSGGDKSMPIFMGDPEGNLRASTIGELLPDAFVFKKK